MHCLGRAEAVRQARRPLVGRPGDVALADPRHNLAERQGEIRVRAAPEPPHADDAQGRLVERGRLSVRGPYGLPAVLGPYRCDVATAIGEQVYVFLLLEIVLGIPGKA